MAVERVTCDTNILFYAIDGSDTSKQAHATLTLQLLRGANAFLPLQALTELCGAVSRRRKDLLPSAELYVEGAREAFEVFAASPDDLPVALQAYNRHNLSFWDALLWATARRAGCTLLLTEDFQEGRTLQGVTFRNPFLLSPHQLRSLLT